MDVVSEILQKIPVKGRVTAEASLKGKWTFESPDFNEGVFHIITKGSAFLTYGSGETTVSEGDIVLFPRGSLHRVSADKDSANLSPYDYHAQLENTPSRDMHSCKVLELNVGGDASPTRLICGGFFYGKAAAKHLIAHLPEVMILRKSDPWAEGWLDGTIKTILREIRSEKPGALAVLDPVLDLIFVQLVRHWALTSNAPDNTWFKIISDAKISSALSLMHETPADPWSVSELASRVGMSRSAFAARFLKVVGEPPLRYLTRWRLTLAAQTLETDSRRTVGDVALSVGYDSEASFSAAFKRQFGQPPGLWRKNEAHRAA
jgi:AraC-like DNA-binding protein